MYEWKRRLRAASVTPFIAVEVVSTEVALAETRKMSGIEIRHRRGWSVLVEPGFDARHLRRLLAVLKRHRDRSSESEGVGLCAGSPVLAGS
jgi:hypothetical protein